MEWSDDLNSRARQHMRVVVWKSSDKASLSEVWQCLSLELTIDVSWRGLTILNAYPVGKFMLRTCFLFPLGSSLKWCLIVLLLQTHIDFIAPYVSFFCTLLAMDAFLINGQCLQIIFCLIFLCHRIMLVLGQLDYVKFLRQVNVLKKYLTTRIINIQ